MSRRRQQDAPPPDEYPVPGVQPANRATVARDVTSEVKRRPDGDRGGAGDLGRPDQASSSLGQWAARYAAAGLSVLPLHSIRNGMCTCRRDCGRNAGKHPCTHNGKDDASTDAEQVAVWWTRWPWANVGIRPPAGVVVLDVDPRHNGAAALLALTQRHAPLPTTLTAWTGGGGLHVWLAYAGPARGALCPGGAVDVKTNHGYVVAPPSLHASGQRYAWANDLPTAPAPRWVRHLLNPPRPQGHYHPNTAAAGGSDAGLIRAVAGAVKGNRNSVLHWAACRAHERGSDPALLHELIAAATAVGLPELEARKTVQSAARHLLAGAA